MARKNEKPNAWIIDTSILTNIYSIPGKCQHHEEVIKEFRVKIQQGDHFFLPYPVIVEMGNFIAQLSGNDKYTKATLFVEDIRKTLEGKLPGNL